MAEQLTNALVSPSATLVTATVTANVTTAFDLTWDEPDPPTSGTYSLLFKGAATDGSDDSIFRVSAISGSSVTNGSWEKVGAQASFTAGAELELDHSAAAVNAVIADLKAAANTWAAVQTYAAQSLFPDGSAGTPAISNDGDPNTGMIFDAADQIGLVTGGTKRVTLTTAVLSSTLPFRTANGSAAAPSHSFSSVSTAGMYAPAANTIGFSTSSTLRFTISAAAYIQASLPFLVSSGAIALGGTLISGAGTTTNILTTDSSRIVVDTVGAGETLQWYAPSALSSPLDGALHIVTDAQKNAAANNIVITDDIGTTVGTINTDGGSAIVQVDRVNNLFTCNVIA